MDVKGERVDAYECGAHRVQKRGVRASGAGVAGGCELPRECCELTSGPLQEQDMS